jgi:hypothetical protein
MGRCELRANLWTRGRIFEPLVASVIYFSPKVDRLVGFTKRIERH